MDTRLVLENGMVTLGIALVGSHLYDNADGKFEIHVLGFLLCAFVLVSMHQLLPQLNPALKRPEENRVHYRIQADSGLWCCLMFPLAWVSYGIREHDLPVLETCFLLFSLACVLVHYNPTNRSQMAGALLLLWLRDHLVQFDVQYLLLFGGCIALFYLLLSKIPALFPNSFTEGEITIVLQVFMVALLTVLKRLLEEGVDIAETMNIDQTICLAAIVGVVSASLLLLLLSYKTQLGSSTVFYVSYLMAAIFNVIPVLVFILGPTALHKIYHYIVTPTTRLNLFLSWASLVGVSACTIFAVNALSRHISGETTCALKTCSRKIFHGIILVVFITGLQEDPAFLSTSAVVALGVLVILETVRMLDVFPLGKMLRQNYSIFIDSQDQGRIILTPLYLLMGMALPVWLHSVDDLPDIDLRVYAGVLSIGIGDACASIGGSLYGHYKWPGSKKTFEGTVTSIICQLFTVYSLYNVYDVTFSGSRYQAIILTALLEAFTTQIDNLVLPLYMFSLLSINTVN